MLKGGRFSGANIQMNLVWVGVAQHKWKAATKEK